MDELDDEPEDELTVLEKAKPSNNPTPEDIARLHELHARHEREAGRYDRAAAAEARARRARANTQPAPPPDDTGTPEP